MLLSRKQRWRRLCRPHSVDPSLAIWGSGNFDDLLRRSKSTSEILCKGRYGRMYSDGGGDSNATNTSERDCPNDDSETDVKAPKLTRSRRSVSFDDAIRVILVPTRHELKSASGKGDGGNRSRGDEKRREDGAREVRWDGGIWWSYQECLGFRQSFRRQLLSLGFNTIPSILNPDTVQRLAQADDDEEALAEGRQGLQNATREQDEGDGGSHGACDAPSPAASSTAAALGAAASAAAPDVGEAAGSGRTAGVETSEFEQPTDKDIKNGDSGGDGDDDGGGGNGDCDGGGGSGGAAAATAATTAAGAAAASPMMVEAAEVGRRLVIVV